MQKYFSQHFQGLVRRCIRSRWRQNNLCIAMVFLFPPTPTAAALRHDVKHYYPDQQSRT
ncbi:hypothetical protein ACVIW0_007396 [Bradyrhizobium sp. USDA 4454]